MKNLLIVLTLSLFATSAFATQNNGHKGGGAQVKATNDSRDAIAVGGDVLAVTIDYYGAAGLDVYSGNAIAGSIVVNPSDCRCYKSLKLNNTSRGSLAVGSGSAGSIVIR